MMAEKSSFLLYFSYRKHLALLSDEECGKLLMALFDYAENGQEPELTGATAMAFSFIQDQMERDADKYAAVCERNRKNGAKGGRPSKATKSENNPDEPKITERLSEKPKKPDYDYDYDYDYDDNDKDICTETEVSIPKEVPIKEIFISLPLNDKTEHEVEKSEIDTWKDLYPSVNIEQELRSMKGWLIANSTKRKTKKGINRFINNWLAREQDKGYPNKGGENVGKYGNRIQFTPPKRAEGSKVLFESEIL